MQVEPEEEETITITPNRMWMEVPVTDYWAAEDRAVEAAKRPPQNTEAVDKKVTAAMERNAAEERRENEIIDHTVRFWRILRRLNGSAEELVNTDACSQCRRFFVTSDMEPNNMDDWQGHMPSTCFCCKQGFVLHRNEDAKLHPWKPPTRTTDKCFNVTLSCPEKTDQVPLRVLKALTLDGSMEEARRRQRHGDTPHGKTWKSAEQEEWDESAIAWGWRFDTDKVLRKKAANEQWKGWKEEGWQKDWADGWNYSWSSREDWSASSSDWWGDRQGIRLGEPHQERGRNHDDNSHRNFVVADQGGCPVKYKGDAWARISEFQRKCKRMWRERSSRNGSNYQSARSTDFKTHRDAIIKSYEERNESVPKRRELALMVVERICQAACALTNDFKEMTPTQQKAVKEAYVEYTQNFAAIAEDPIYVPSVDGATFADKILQHLETITPRVWEFWICRSTDCQKIIQNTSWVTQNYVLRTQEYLDWSRADPSIRSCNPPVEYSRELAGPIEDASTWSCPACGLRYNPFKGGGSKIDGQKVVVFVKTPDGHRKPVTCLEEAHASDELEMFLTEWVPSTPQRFLNRLKEIAHNLAEELKGMTHRQLSERFDEINRSGCPIQWSKGRRPDWCDNDWEHRNRTTKEGHKGKHFCYWMHPKEFEYFQYDHRQGDVILNQDNWISMLAMAFAVDCQAKAPSARL